MNGLGRLSRGAAGLLDRAPASRPAADLDRQLRAAERELTAAEEALEQAQADERDLGALSVDDYLGTLEPGEYERRRADVQLRLVEGEREVARWKTIVDGVREKAISVVVEANDAKLSTVLAERTQLANERLKLLRKLDENEQADDALARREKAIEDERLPALARLDPAAAEALKAREKDRHDEAVQLAHQRIRGEDVDVPEELAALVRKEEPLIRADLAEQKRAQQEHFQRIGTLKLTEHEYSPDGARRRGFADPDED
jgi:hypothetical protein